MKKSIDIKNIDDAFLIFEILISNKESCEKNQNNLSKLAINIDAYALGSIINYFNDYPEIGRNKDLWKSNLYVIKMLSVFVTEICNYSLSDKSSLSQLEPFSDIFLMRNKIHQFKYRTFKKDINKIDSKMGRSRNKLLPNMDLFIEYLSYGKHVKFIGTNIYQFRFEEANKQLNVDLMQKIVRIFEERSQYISSSFKIKCNYLKPRYKAQVYCYTDILKDAKIKNENLIDRLLFAFDDLCCVYEFFKFTISTDIYLKEAPYLLYFLCKSVAISLDETFDNINNYILNTENNGDKVLIKNAFQLHDRQFIDLCKTFRNNLHYERQETILIDEKTELYDLLIRELNVVELLMDQIEDMLNIRPSKLKLLSYRFF